MVIEKENINAADLPENLENFSFLRDKALEYIQRTSSQTWTDHNIHDPGITIMEALCYSLADVGFRMNFPMHDLVTDNKGKLATNGFYLPQEILPCHPVTINDFRKILIDLPTIKNAWITPQTRKDSKVEPDYAPIYIFKKEGRLITEYELKTLPIPATEKEKIRTEHAVFINGLYAINIEFDSNPEYGQPDSGENFTGIYDKDHFGDLYFDIGNWNKLMNSKRILKMLAEAYSSDPNSLTLNILHSPKNKYNNNDGKLDERILGEWYYTIEILINGKYIFSLQEVLFQPYLDNKKGIRGTDLKNIIQKNTDAFVKPVFKKIVALAGAYQEVEAVLHKNRNFCEDFLPQVGAVPAIEFRICADIDVDPGADIEQVQAMIFHKISEYLSPPIQFYSFNEARRKGKSIEEILEGPKLEHGFLFEEEMGINAFQGITIHLSDIINAVYETEGLINCRNVQLIVVDENGKKLVHENNWEVKIPGGYKPILNKRKSKLIFYKNNLPLSAHFRESMIRLSHISSSGIKISNAELPSINLGQKYRDLALHYSIANEFPATYKIGKNFPDAYLDKRELYTSKQLEGYLLLFEQLVANFLTDLDNLKNTLSWKNIDHIQHTSTANEWRRSYLLGEKLVDAEWQKTIESPSRFLKKRNASLDYLLSRFAEDLHEMDNYFYLSSDNIKINRSEYYQYLVKLKQRFLSNYITISANRGAAVNIIRSESYFSTPPSGYEERLAALLGCELVEDGKRRSVSSLSGNKEERGYFHVLEHILLRLPSLNNEVLTALASENISPELLSICADNDCTACDGTDPYSFTASIVLPSWIGVYKDVHYRDFIEKLIRKNTPAGVLLRICWVDEITMKNYEDTIEPWWKAKQQLFTADINMVNEKMVDYIKKQNELIKAIKSQRSEYFKATLHGCSDEGEENNTRIFLDRTFLGND